MYNYGKTTCVLGMTLYDFYRYWKFAKTSYYICSSSYSTLNTIYNWTKKSEQTLKEEIQEAKEILLKKVESKGESCSLMESSREKEKYNEFQNNKIIIKDDWVEVNTASLVNKHQKLKMG